MSLKIINQEENRGIIHSVQVDIDQHLQSQGSELSELEQKKINFDVDQYQ